VNNCRPGIKLVGSSRVKGAWREGGSEDSERLSGAGAFQVVLTLY
jgi:hypothetical protein